jgi:hypothetical protein
VRLYKSDPNYIRPLDTDVQQVFDPERNNLFAEGAQLKRWVLYNAQQELIGRVAAFINPRIANVEPELPTGGMGFFDCTNDQAAANILLDAAKNWLQQQGMKAIDGPINLGDRDRWWGCLVEGYHPPNYCMPYNAPYYKELLEAYGFKEFFKQFTYARTILEMDNPLFQKLAERLFAKPEYRFEHLQKSNINKYAEDFRLIYNQAWASHEGVAELTKEQAQKLIKTMKPVIDPEAIWFAYKDDKPVGFYVQIPQLNEMVRKFDGKFHLLNKLRLVYAVRRKKIKSLFGVVFGVVPEVQNRGVEAGLIHSYQLLGKRRAAEGKNTYNWLEMNWIGDFNPKMMKICDALGASIHKTHATYRLILDPSVPFERMKPIE